MCKGGPLQLPQGGEFHLFGFGSYVIKYSVNVVQVSTQGVFIITGGSVVKRNTVLEWNFSPGRSSVEGNCGLLGESARCIVSRQMAERRG